MLMLYMYKWNVHPQQNLNCVHHSLSEGSFLVYQSLSRLLALWPFQQGSGSFAYLLQHKALLLQFCHLCFNMSVYPNKLLSYMSIIDRNVFAFCSSWSPHSKTFSCLRAKLVAEVVVDPVDGAIGCSLLSDNGHRVHSEIDNLNHRT